MNTKTLKGIIIILLLIGLFIFGFLLGRGRIRTNTEIIEKYIQLPPIHDTITNIKPVKVYAPVDTARIIEKCVEDGIYAELFPDKIIEKEIYLTSEDTLAIIADWATRRIYEETLFDVDTLGSCFIVAEVQYNRLGQIEYTYKPIRKETTIIETVEKKFEPFIGISLFTDNSGEVEVGSYIKSHYGVSVLYRKEFGTNAKSIGAGIKYKF